MKICLVIEGAYPYVQGGVSSWVEIMIRRMPEYEFVLQTVAATAADRGRFKYPPPDNLTAISEAVLMDDDVVVETNRKYSMTKKQRAAVRSLVFMENEDWDTVFEMFHGQHLSINDVLMGKDFYEIVREYYSVHYARVVFTDFLWTIRSVFLPVMLVLKNKVIEADMYHAVSTGYAGIMACCAGHIYNKPIILTEHGIYTREREEEIIRASWTKGIYKDLWINHFYMLSRCVYKRAAKVFSLFERARAMQIELGCPVEKTETVHNGVNIKKLGAVPPKNPDDPHINVGAIVRVTPIKDIKTMISAFHLAKEKMSSLKLYIIGNTEEDPDYYNECVGLIEMLGTRDIVFTGHVVISEYIGNMDMIILTSISEGQPLSVLEAMAASKPCITTQVGDCYDMLDAGSDENRAGLVVPVMSVGQVSQAILTLAADPELRKKMGENGKRIVHEFYTEDIYINRYKAIYEELYHPSVKPAAASETSRGLFGRLKKKHVEEGA